MSDQTKKPDQMTKAELLALVQEVQELDSEGSVTALPLVSWTIKLLHPDSSEPDFIRIEGHPLRMDEMAGEVTAFRAHLRDTHGYVEVQRGGKTPVVQTAPSPTRPSEPAVSQPLASPGSEPLVQDADGSDVAWQAELKRRPDGRLELAVWGYLSDGAQMNYPLLRYIAVPEKMLEALLPVGWENIISDDEPLPVRHDVNWLVHWKQGKPTGKGGHYKDLLSLEVMP